MKHISLVPFWVLIGVSTLLHLSASEMQSIDGCRLKAMRGADGDSFMVMLPDGREQVIRLYAVDCVEASIWDENDSLRLREQRRYFGISSCGPTLLDSITMAKKFGREAHQVVTELLSEPFTIHTSFADGRGSGYHSRVYAYVTTAAGHDLGTHLVAHGLARAFGVTKTFGERTDDDWKDFLKDVELQAAAQRRGVWAETDWSSFVSQRDTQRIEEAELALAIDRAKRTGIVDPNTAPRDELMSLQGIGETLAIRIIENRPYKSADDLLAVERLSESVLAKNKNRLPTPFRVN